MMTFVKKIGMYLMALVSVWGIVDILYRVMEYLEDSDLSYYSEGRLELVLIIAIIAFGMAVMKYFHNVAKRIGKKPEVEVIEIEES